MKVAADGCDHTWKGCLGRFVLALLFLAVVFESLVRIDAAWMAHRERIRAKVWAEEGFSAVPPRR